MRAGPAALSRRPWARRDDRGGGEKKTGGNVQRRGGWSRWVRAAGIAWVGEKKCCVMAETLFELSFLRLFHLFGHHAT
jgi:hypothetical protein